MGAPRSEQHTGRTRSRRGQGRELHDEILAAVNRLLDEWGSVDRLTIRAVAAEVGVAAPSVYLHFSDKTELVWAALSTRYEQLAASMRAADEASDPDDAIARLRAQVYAYCRFGLEKPGHYRLMYEMRQPAVDASRMRRHPGILVSGSLREATARCRDAGCALSLPSEQMALTLWVGLHGTISLTHSLYASASMEAMTLSLADGLLDSLVAPPGERVGSGTESSGTDAMRQIRALLDGTEDDM